MSRTLQRVASRGLRHPGVIAILDDGLEDGLPWYDGPDWDLNPHFVGQVKKIAGQNHAQRPVVLICRSGNRTIEAGEALERAGFKRVINVLHGFEGPLDEKHHRNTKSGWRVDGLPWEQY